MKAAIEANWEAYHYCMGYSPSVELSIGRYLTWVMTNLPDHFMNVVVCNQLPSEGVDNLIEATLTRFRLMNIGRFSWLTDASVESVEINMALLAHGFTFRESFATKMAVDLSLLPESIMPRHLGLRIVAVDSCWALRQWINVASIGFGVKEEYRKVWDDFFADTIFSRQFRTYLALLDGKPVGTSQLFLSEGVAGIYNVTVIPNARGHGIGSAITLAPLLEARKLGYRIGILQASRRGYGVDRRLGFQDFGNLSLYLWESDHNLM